MVSLDKFLGDLEANLSDAEKAELLFSLMENKAENMRFVLAHAMKLAREEEGMTQQKLSELTGIPQPELSRLERQKANPTLETIAKLYVALGISHRVYFKHSKAKSDYLEQLTES